MIENITSIFSDQKTLKLEINWKRKLKNPNMWRLNNILYWQNDLVKKEIKDEIKRHIEKNEKDNMTFQNFLDTVKAVIRGKFISLQAYLNKQEKPQVNNLALNLN